MLTTATSHRAYRNRQAAIIQAVAGAVGFLATAPPALTASRGDHTTLIVFKVVFVSLATAFLVLALRGALSAIRVVDGGVKVVNPLSTRTFSWGEISEFELARWAFFPGCVWSALRTAEPTTHGASPAGTQPSLGTIRVPKDPSPI